MTARTSIKGQYGRKPGAGARERDDDEEINHILLVLRAFEAYPCGANLNTDGDPATRAPGGPVTEEDVLCFLARLEGG
jgi:hypothetical protein